jgi:dipeptidyl aminopeptidase/acylaminoacyl peptidase
MPLTAQNCDAAVNCPMAEIAPYGSWKSPLSAALVATGEVGIEQVRIDGDDVYWIERRAQEGGRKVIVRRSVNGEIADVLPEGYNARTRVHEYGGGDYAVSGGIIVFANFNDQRLYIQKRRAAPQPLTPAGAWRYADGRIDPRRNLFFCVREDHSGSGEPVNTLAAVDTRAENSGTVIAAGNDFYAAPRLSPDGARLAWLTWNHPNMPWDGTELWVGDVRADGSIGEKVKIAGGVNESIVEPQWSPDGTLYFVSDRSGWWNLCRRGHDGTEAIYPLDAEFGHPHWVFGTSLYGFASASSIVCSYSSEGRDHLASLDLTRRELKKFELPVASVAQLSVAGDRVVFIGASSTEPAFVGSMSIAAGELLVLRRSRAITVDAAYLSEPRAVEFPTANGRTAHAYFYAPRNPDFSAPADHRPPLLVISHGGPTSSSSAALKYSVQYWTSRGIALLDVNYGGSSGYGRAYRERLYGQWGVVDVDDCVNGALYLVERGFVDGNRLAIRGGSAGGYTTLCALTFRSVFKAGASHYGVSDLETLAKDTHKFESRYLDKLIGPYPERRDLYIQRSPIHFTERLSCPMILFQGLEDKIVPPNQAEKMAAALRARSLPVALLAFAGEQHGFRKAENIKRVLEAELYFYSRVFGFDLAEPVAPVNIENLTDRAPL